MRNKALITLIFSLLLIGCSNTPPTTELGQKAYIIQAMGDAQTDIKYFTHSFVFYDTFDISFFDEWVYLMLALTDEKVHFYEWRRDANEYNLRTEFLIDSVSRIRSYRRIGVDYIGVKHGNEFISFSAIKNFDEILKHISTVSGVTIEN